MSDGLISIPEHILYQRTGNAMVLLDSSKGQYFELNDTAACAFQALLDSPDLAAACNALTAEFDVSQNQAERDLKNLIEELTAAGLLDESNNTQ